MIKDKEEAFEAVEFHKGCTFEVGPRGGIKEHHVIWRKGKTKVWKRDPNRFQITCQHGLKNWDYFTENELNSVNVFTEKTCPAIIAREGYEDKSNNS